MGPENLIIQLFITAESLNPYAARAIALDRTRGPVSLDQPLKTREGEISKDFTLADIISDSRSVENIAEAEFTKQQVLRLARNSGLSDEEHNAFYLRFFRDYALIDIAKSVGSNHRQRAVTLLNRALNKIKANPDTVKIFGKQQI